MARFLTFNTFLLDVRLFGRWTVYPPAPFVEARLRTLPAALAATGADVIALQEVYRRPHRRYLADQLAADYPHTGSVEPGGRPLGTGLFVLSHHPVISAEMVEFRAALLEERIAIRMGMLDCTIATPDLGRLRLIDFHLVAGGLGGHPEGRRGETRRARQIGELTRRGEAPSHGTVVMAGDLNASQEASPAHSWDPGNPLISGALNRSLPPQRMDHVFLGRAGSASLAAENARIVLTERVVDAGPASAPLPLSDHYGVTVDIVDGSRVGGSGTV